MPTIRLYHWKAAEASPLIRKLQGNGYSVDYPSDSVLERGFRSLSESPPHASHRSDALAFAGTTRCRSDPIPEDGSAYTNSLRERRSGESRADTGGATGCHVHITCQAEAHAQEGEADRQSGSAGLQQSDNGAEARH